MARLAPPPATPLMDRATKDLSLPWLNYFQYLSDTLKDAGTAADTAAPIGSVKWYAGASEPAGWFLCDGRQASRTLQAGLFAVIGTTYGAGDGATTFNLPDLRGRVPVAAGAGAGLTSRAVAATGGEEAHSLTTTELAAHGHGVTDPQHSHALTDLGHTHSLNNPTHTHTVTDTGHTHSLSDPGHNHTLTDPGHTHPPAAGSFLETGGSSTYEGSAPNLAQSAASTGAAYTGIAVQNRATGVTAVASTTGIALGSTATAVSALAATTGLTMGAASTGITVQNTGGGVAHNTMPPFLCLNAIIKY